MFTHLHVHTEYSLLDGCNKINEYVARVKELGMNSAAITDHGVMFGCIDFYKAAKEAGIKPILGCEVYVAPGSRFDKEAGSVNEERYFHLVLLAENLQGYQNLIKIVSKGYTEGYYYKPRVDKEVLREYHEGIIASSACLAGEISRDLVKGFYEEACDAARSYEEIFGKGNFFLELQDHGIEEQKLVNRQLLRMSRELAIPLIATNDIHYTYAEDAEPHDILLCVQTNRKVDDPDRMRYEGGQYFVKSEKEMQALFSYVQEALDNTQKIADRCNVELTFHELKLPKYDPPEGYTAWEYLCKLCQDGLKERYEDVTKDLEDRLNYELETIQRMGYVDYFLIVWDYVKFAQDHDIIVGPGRGSAAGSIVSYTLGITKLDPIRYNLLFERFLNPERVSMPDIDVDFCFERRQEVIDYVVEKYGKDCVVQIVTFGTMKAKNAIRDVGRALDMPYAAVDQVAKMIPGDLGMTIKRAMEMNPELKKAYDSDSQVRYLIDMSQRLEGLPRHTSMHAAGVVISGRPVDEYVPLLRTNDDVITTQYTMTTLEELGLLKMDFLGLRTLTVIQNAVREVERIHGVALDMDHIDYNDQKTLAMIGKANTEGVFQLESEGMKNFMKELKPQSLEDIIAGISLYRPGPMDFIPQYIRGKNNPDSITYDCPQLEPILEPTYGCIVYQEQVMQIVRALAGYSLGRSDLLRRAMSKKKATVMERERQNFVYGNPEENVPGCVRNGIDEKTANKIYDDMTDFAKYAFNKSHAAAYAYVSIQTAYLKCYYPVEFMAALMTSVIDAPGKVAEYILTCRQMGIRLLPPDVNKSVGRFSVEDGCIRYGLYAIKSVGTPVINTLIEARDKGGAFTSLRDFIDRTWGRETNKRALENFIKAGAFDSLGGTRNQFMIAYSQMSDEVARQKKAALDGQMSLFDFAGDDERQRYEMSLPDVDEFSKGEKLAYEKEVLGVYISGHPLEDYEKRWRKHITALSTDFLVDEENGTSKVNDGARETIGGMITDKTVKYTKTNKMMAFVTVEDLVGSVEVIVFPRDYEKNAALLNEDDKVFITGRVSAEEDKPSKLICESVKSFDDVRRELWIQYRNKADFEQDEPSLYAALADSDGRDAVMVYLKEEKQMKRLGANRNVKIDDGLIAELQKKYGNDNIRVTEART